ncbi:MAG: carboxymuconolactone decarboxylase family protein [Myxococcaceae bacterium]|nr:carboxymuconolactone decarboxylase family protein [Myxococcaceae bacterium]
MPFVPPPEAAPWFLRPMLWLTRRITGKDPLPARLLAHAPKAAVGAGVFELLAAGAPADLDGRSLAVARLVASVVGGCPFCVDMNAATWSRAGLTAGELALLLGDEQGRWPELGLREAVAARYARALSLTPVEVDPALVAELTSRFSAREVVVLASTIAQVNFWTRFNQGLGVPAAGFFDERACALPERFRAPKG